MKEQNTTVLKNQKIKSSRILDTVGAEIKNLVEVLKVRGGKIS